MTDTDNISSTRPYLIRALHEWCTDNAFTPYIAVRVDGSVQVPREHVKNGEIVLNVSLDATSSLKLGNEFIEFRARFGGVAREVQVPVGRVIAIYARENGQGMAFPLEEVDAQAVHASEEAAPSPGVSGDAPAEARPAVQLTRVETDRDEPPPPSSKGGGTRPSLKRVK
jgi:stringent starvation protein B